MKTYLVGGAIRDELLGIPVHERDWVVVGSTPEEMLSFGYKQVGKDFPVFLHPKSSEEYALARTEKKNGYGYNGFICYTSPNISLKEDLSRRDLTINAIARDYTGNIIDPYNGIEDIKKRVLKHVSQAFIEDPLRVLRVARFAAKLAYLNFKIDLSTLDLMKSMIKELLFLSPERIWRETQLALSTNNPQIYFQVLYNIGALKKIFPEIDNLFNYSMYLESYKKINIGLNALKTLSLSTNLTNDISLRFSTLCYFLKKIEFYDYNKNNISLIKLMSKRLKIPNKIKDLLKINNKFCDLVHDIEKLSSNEIIKLLYDIDVWRKPNILKQLIKFSEIIFLSLNKNNQYKFTQEKFLLKAYKIANSIDIRKLINKKTNGTQLKNLINKLRKEKLTTWKMNYL